MRTCQRIIFSWAGKSRWNFSLFKYRQWRFTFDIFRPRSRWRFTGLNYFGASMWMEIWERKRYLQRYMKLHWTITFFFVSSSRTRVNKRKGEQRESVFSIINKLTTSRYDEWEFTHQKEKKKTWKYWGDVKVECGLSKPRLMTNSAGILKMWE